MYINRTQRIPGSEPSLKQLRKRSGDASSSQSFASILEVDVVEIGDPEQKEKGHQERGNRDHLRGVGLYEWELDVLGIKGAGE